MRSSAGGCVAKSFATKRPADAAPNGFEM
jgi:hypothetical protein